MSSKQAAADAHSKRCLLTTAGAPRLIDLLFIQRQEGTRRGSECSRTGSVSLISI